MEPFRDDNDLIAELRALRPDPAPGLRRRARRARRRGLPAALGALGVSARRALRTACERCARAPGCSRRRRLRSPRSSRRPWSSRSASRDLRLRLAGPSHRDRLASPEGGSRQLDSQPKPPAKRRRRSSGGVSERDQQQPSARPSGVRPRQARAPANASSDGTGPYASAGSPPRRRTLRRDRPRRRSRRGRRRRRQGLRRRPRRPRDRPQLLDPRRRRRRSRGQFELLIPSAKLGDALAAFSGIDEVLSRHEATDDITAPTVGVERTPAGLAGQGRRAAGTARRRPKRDGERAAVEAELRAERRHAAALRSQLTTLQRRANLSRVSLRIETGDRVARPTAAAAGESATPSTTPATSSPSPPASRSSASRSSAPLALIALLIWLANRAWARRAASAPSRACLADPRSELDAPL